MEREERMGGTEREKGSLEADSQRIVERKRRRMGRVCLFAPVYSLGPWTGQDIQN